MIHQLIFASPKPGMTEREFQKYWIEVHAVQFAAKIRQILRYRICAREDITPADANPLFGGVAEIWLADEQSQLESLQSAEFLQGARLDEPRWAAFWQTLVLDTDAREISATGRSDPADDEGPAGFKYLVLLKRREGMRLDAFRAHALDAHAQLVAKLPGLRRQVQCHSRDASYGVGEARFDCAVQWWFDGPGALRQALSSEVYEKHVKPDLLSFVEPRYIFPMATREHWIIGPQVRAPR